MKTNYLPVKHFQTQIGGTLCKNDLKMNNYSPPSQWPITRWIAFGLTFIPCWLFGWGAAKGFHLLVEKPLGENIVTGLIQVVIYYGGCVFAFVTVGIYAMAFIEAILKYIWNE